MSATHPSLQRGSRGWAGARIVSAAALVAAGVGACGPGRPHAARAPQPPRSLAGSLDPLVAGFNADRQRLRFLAILSPT